ncbi:hypothetical protein BGZ73_003661 [Actinomortierella ambigua]|nr:hypothetical protein BGZ73_003661 [Actinomortierella ambigua]
MEDSETMTRLLYAAEHSNDMEAQVQLSQLYEQSTTLPDTERASLSLAWCRRAAEQGHLQAQVHLGNLYYRGIGTEPCFVQARYWYRQAAEQGDKVAQHCLGMVILERKGVGTCAVGHKDHHHHSDNDNIHNDCRVIDHRLPQQCSDTPCTITKNTNNYHTQHQKAEQQPSSETDKEALHWIRLSAHQGYAIAQHQLGLFYQAGIGVSQDDIQAVEWFRQASQQHFGPSLTSLGRMVQMGRGGMAAPDPVQAMALFRQAAEMGFPGAQFHLATMYLTGEALGVREDGGEGDGAWSGSGPGLGGDGVAHTLGPSASQDQVDQDKEKEDQGKSHGDDPATTTTKNLIAAAKWYREAAERGLSEAQTNLGVMYKTGQGVLQNDKLAAYWYHRSAVQGSVVAQINLGLMYRDGHGLEQNVVEAATWFLRAAEQGSAVAQMYLGAMYESGSICHSSSLHHNNKNNNSNRSSSLCQSHSNSIRRSCSRSSRCSSDSTISSGSSSSHNTLRPGSVVQQQQSHVEALKWYRQAAAQGLAKAQFHLGWLYRTGSGGLDQNDVEAAAWYRQAADQALPEAMTDLAKMYLCGQGVEQDKTYAEKLLRQAADLGDACARLQLEWLAEHGGGDNTGQAQEEGGGRPRDSSGLQDNAETSAEWYWHTSMHGRKAMPDSLGILRKHGGGVLEHDHMAAQGWLRPATTDNGGDDEEREGLHQHCTCLQSPSCTEPIG